MLTTHCPLCGERSKLSFENLSYLSLSGQLTELVRRQQELADDESLAANYERQRIQGGMAVICRLLIVNYKGPIFTGGHL